MFNQHKVNETHLLPTNSPLLPTTAQNPNKTKRFSSIKITPDDIETITPQEAKTFHQDKKHKYEYRTGHSGHYEYNYDVIGVDQDDNKVSGK